MMQKPPLSSSPANHIAVFQETTIRRVWHNEEWWFSVVDVCAILTESPDAGAYWRKLKQRLNAEGGQPVTFCHALKLQAPDRIDARLIAPIPTGWGPFAPTLGITLSGCLL